MPDNPPKPPTIPVSDKSDSRRECGEPLNDGTGRICRKVVHPTLGYHGDVRHFTAEPDIRITETAATGAEASDA